MTNPTTPFSWQMPTASDLVTDLPADFETFGQAVATSMADLLGGTTGQILSKASNTDMDFTWVTNDVGDITAVTAGTGLSGGGTSGAVTLSIDTATTVDLSTAQTLTNKTLTSPVLTTPTISTINAKGDLLAGTADNTIAALTVGANDTVLTADSSTATGLKWAAAAGGGSNWSLLNAGGTALTGAQTITVSGISGKNSIMVVFVGASNSSAGTSLGIRLNTDTGTKYDAYGTYVYSPASYVTGGISQQISTTNGTYIPIGVLSGSAGSAGSGYCLIQGTNATGVKPYQSVGGFSRDGNDSQQNYIVGGLYTGTSTISSISMFSPSANFDAGTVYVYTTA
jgi:predicted secreted protein